jgi:hypothetical protein
VQRKDVGITWADVTKQQLTTERCVTLETKVDGNYGLGYSQCSATKSVLCEVNNYFFYFFHLRLFFLFLCGAVHLRECFLHINMQR